MSVAEKEEYEKNLLEEVRMEYVKNNLFMDYFSVISFISYSRGKGKKRKTPCYIILIRVRSQKKWIFWNGNGNLSKGRYLFDKWATEIFGEKFCACLNENPGEYLRGQLLLFLEKFKRF